MEIVRDVVRLRFEHGDIVLGEEVVDILVSLCVPVQLGVIVVGAVLFIALRIVYVIRVFNLLMLALFTIIVRSFFLFVLLLLFLRLLVRDTRLATTS